MRSWVLVTLRRRGALIPAESPSVVDRGKHESGSERRHHPREPICSPRRGKGGGERPVEARITPVHGFPRQPTGRRLPCPGARLARGERLRAGWVGLPHDGGAAARV